MTPDDWALVGGIVVLVVWVCIVSYVGVLRNAYTLGRTDAIEKKNRSVDYEGLACWAYTRGRRKEAMVHKLLVRSRHKPRA